MKVKLIINPKSGRIKRKMPPILKWNFKIVKNRFMAMFRRKTTPEESVEEVKKRCDEEKIQLDIEFTKYPKHATELARSARNKYDMVIVAGGDGTINEVINGIKKSKTTLAIIPFGSANVLALELGIPFNPEKAAELISKGKKISIDLGYAKTSQEGRYFSMMTGVGFDASVIDQISPKFKKKWGKFAYPIAGIKHLFKYKWHNINVKHKSHSLGYLVLISNCKYYAGEYQIADKANITDGFLDLVVINRRNFWQIIKIVSSLMIGKANKFLEGEYYHTKNAHVYCEQKMFVHVDGELIGTAPVKVKVVPKALNVMVRND